MDMDMIEDRASARFPNSVTHRFGFVEGWKACVGLYFGDGPVAPKPAEDGEPTTAQLMDKLAEMDGDLRASANAKHESTIAVLGRVSDVVHGMQARFHDQERILVDVGQKVEAVLDQVTTVENHQAGDLTDIPVKRLNDLEELFRHTKADPNASEPYLRGLNNGIILAHATIFDHECVYIEHEETRAEAVAAAKETLRKRVDDEQHMAAVLESREAYKPGDVTYVPDGKARTILGVDAAAPGSDQTVYVILNHPVSRELYEAFMQFGEGQRARISKLEKDAGYWRRVASNSGDHD